jgi:hypothetical protein
MTTKVYLADCWGISSFDLIHETGQTYTVRKKRMDGTPIDVKEKKIAKGRFYLKSWASAKECLLFEAEKDINNLQKKIDAAKYLYNKIDAMKEPTE